MNGILNVYKEPGFTSHDVVAKLRGICKQKKIGHTGTLDPEASGYCPVCLGNATKLCDLLTDKDKEYRAVLLLGVETDTQDTTGQILAEKEVNAGEEDVRSAILSFVGPYDQIPPMYSALKVNGQKLCDLARKGQVVERKSRRITIHSIEIEDISLPRVTMRVACSAALISGRSVTISDRSWAAAERWSGWNGHAPAISKLRMPIGFPSWKCLQKKAAWKKSFFRWSACLNSWMHIRCRATDRSF